MPVDLQAFFVPHASPLASSPGPAEKQIHQKKLSRVQSNITASGCPAVHSWSIFAGLWSQIVPVALKLLFHHHFGPQLKYMCVCANLHGYCQGGVGLLQLHLLGSYHTSNTGRTKGKVQSSSWGVYIHKDAAVVKVSYTRNAGSLPLCTGLFLPLVFLNCNDPFTETLCSSGSISNLGRIKFRVGGVVLANLANNGLINVVLYGGRWAVGKGCIHMHAVLQYIVYCIS